VYRRERIIEEFQLGKDDNFFDILYLHNQNIQYTFDLKTKQCTKTTVQRPWRDFGIPKNATFLGEGYIGSSAIPNAGILTDLWTDEFTDQKGNKVEYVGVWTYEGCLPVNIAYYSEAEKLNTHSFFFDISPGIENPNVFTPRPECLNL